MNDLLSIKNLRCGCHIGCKPEERALLQTLFVTIDLELDTRPAAQADDLELTVNYAKLSKDVIALCQESTCQLIETLAQNIAALCLKKTLVKKASVSILKPAGIANADGAVISITRSNGSKGRGRRTKS